MTRLRWPWVLRQVLGRTFLPHHMARWIGRRRMHRRVPSVHANAQLQLYNRILPGDFLHYGYFDDPDTPPETIGFDGLYRAQLRYAEKLIGRIERPGEPVLDAGSGMGGMLGLLRSSGYNVTGLTPDRFQLSHIRGAYPGVPVLGCRFEDLPSGEYSGRFGTVIHSESIQYMNPDGVFGVVREALAPGGTWIVADYFRDARAVPQTGSRSARRRPGASSGWRLGAFREGLEENGFVVARETDITANVLPTLGFARLLATRVGLPAFDFARDKLRAKAPVLDYVLENVAERARETVLQNLAVLDPAGFADRKRYMLMTMRRR